MKDVQRKAPRALWTCLLGCAALSMSACTARIDNPAGAADEAAGDGSDKPGSDAVDDGTGPLSPDTPSTADPNVAGARPLRRLTELEYNNTLRSLLRDPNLPFQNLGGDPQGDHGFTLPGIDVPSQLLLEATEAVSLRASANFSALYQCDPAQEGEATCATRFIDSFGSRAYRKPVEAAERDALLALFTKMRSEHGFDFTGSLRFTMEAILLSPNFLYHWQLGSQKAALTGEAIALTDYELASRLSYFLWSDMPDDTLLTAAGQAVLSSDAALSAQIDRMLADPRGKHTVQTFHAQWLLLNGVLGLSKDPTLFPEWNDELKQAMVQETQAFVADVFAQDEVPLEVLFGASHTFVNETLAKVYGISGVQGAELTRVELDPLQRGGLLTQPGVLAAQSNPGTTNPARAGEMVFANLLCQHISPPPPGATDGFQMKPELSVRQNFEALESQPSCQGCHVLINPPGFAFEQYDAIGRFRTMEGPHRIDASGTFKSRAGDLKFNNLVELSAALATTPELRECVARKWLQFALGRKSTQADRYSLDEAFRSFHEANYDVKKLLKALAMSRTFRFRAPEAGEVM